MNSTSKGLLCLGTWLLALGMPCTATAHPYHVSYAEVEHDRRRDRLEVALRVSPEDLEKILEVRAGRRIDLDARKAADVRALDTLIRNYLRENFGVRDARGNWRPQRFVGKEISAKEVWLYFEIEVPDRMTGYELKDALFFDLQSHQVNTVILRDGSRRRTFTFREAQPMQPIAPAPRRKR